MLVRKVLLNVFLVQQSVQSLFLQVVRQGLRGRRGRSQSVGLSSGRYTFGTGLTDVDEQIVQIVHIVGRILPFGQAVRRPVSDGEARRRRLQSGDERRRSEHQFFARRPLAHTGGAGGRVERLSPVERHVVSQRVQDGRVPARLAAQIAQDDAHLRARRAQTGRHAAAGHFERGQLDQRHERVPVQDEKLDRGRVEDFGRQFVASEGGQVVVLDNGRRQTSGADSHREMADMVHQMIHHLKRIGQIPDCEISIEIEASRDYANFFDFAYHSGRQSDSLQIGIILGAGHS